PAFPRAGQLVEVLPLGARLSNGEKVAERQGVLRRVETTYDPATKKLTLSEELSSGWLTWLTQNLPEGELFLFLRLWDQGDTLIYPEAEELELDYSGEPPVALGTTGLAVNIPTATGRPGDYWIICARPSTTELVSPWELLT